MSAQDRVERVLKDIHLLFSQSPGIAGDPDMIIVNKQEVFALLEKLTLSMYEVMDNYEATQQSRELAKRRMEKQGEQLVARASSQAEDVYAASLIYTEDALGRLQKIMNEAADSAKRIVGQMETNFERERVRIRENQTELVDQLKDFKDSNKYLVMMEECNREREKAGREKQGKEAEKKIQNEAKHYPMKTKPEIKVNPAYFQRRGIEIPDPPSASQEAGSPEAVRNREAKESLGSKDHQGGDKTDLDFGTEELGMEFEPMAGEPEAGIFAAESNPYGEETAMSVVSPTMPSFLDEEEHVIEKAEIKVDLDAEYFRWQAQKGEPERVVRPAPEKKERHFLFGKR